MSLNGEGQGELEKGEIELERARKVDAGGEERTIIAVVAERRMVQGIKSGMRERELRTEGADAGEGLSRRKRSEGSLAREE